MTYDQLTAAINWINKNLDSSPELVTATLVAAKKKFETAVEKGAARRALEDKKAALRLTMEESRKAMKALSDQIKAQKDLEKQQREAEQAAKKASKGKKVGK